MKKIGILFGKERSFPKAFIERVNSKECEGYNAEPVRIDKVMQGDLQNMPLLLTEYSRMFLFTGLI